ncbi:MAG: hypothetical protein U0793_06240 [Gemmataceae bacterium]
MASELTKQERDKLIQAARTAALAAYAPYSKFRVGRPCWGARGSRSGSTSNAELRVALAPKERALASALAKGEKRIRAIAIACIDAAPDRGLSELLPCGACRQWMVELAQDAEIIVCGGERVQSFKVEELIPQPFRLGKPA